MKSEQRSFVIYIRNTYEQYGGYMFQNAEFKANFEKNMTHDSVNIFFKLLLKNLLKILQFGTNYSHRIVHIKLFLLSHVVIVE